MVVKLFILGLPGSGKSSVARYIRTYVGDIGWESVHLNDYGILQRMYRDDIGGKQFKPAAHGGFDVLDLTVCDIALETLGREVQNYNTQEQKMLLIEFSRNDYRSAFRHFNQGFLQDAYFLYLNTTIDICKDRIKERITNPTTEDDYFVSDYIFKAYYNQDDGQYIPDILVRDFKIENSRVKIINNRCSLQEASKEITPFIDHIAPSYQLARRY
jgi:adenylate kinase family enzyme